MPVPPPVALAQATEALRPASVREPCWEPKWDGWRAAYVGGRLWSRRGTELTRYFPDLVPVMRDRLPTDTCVDGELVVWATAAGRLNFAALSRRVVAGHRIASVAIHHPAHFVAFDLLAVGGTDLRRRPLATRREQPQQLMSGLAAPLAVCEQTTEEAVARRWLTAPTRETGELSANDIDVAAGAALARGCLGVLLLADGVGRRAGHRRLRALSRHCRSSVPDDGKSATVSGDSPGPGRSSMRSEADSVGGRSP